jgi:hypothetical protein
MKVSLLICYGASRQVRRLILDADRVLPALWNGHPAIEAGEEVFVLDPRCMILADTPDLNYDARRQTELPEWAQKWLDSNPWWTWESARAMAMFALAHDKVVEFHSMAQSSPREMVH